MLFQYLVISNQGLAEAYIAKTKQNTIIVKVRRNTVI